MGHNICAIIGHENETNIEAIKKYSLAAAFEKGYTIIILFHESVFHWGEELDLGTKSESKELDFACSTTFFLAKEIGFKEYAIIQTDYFGGIGTQSASFYKDGVREKENITINEALLMLGVSPVRNLDCFDTINLGNYRSSEFYYSDGFNIADNKSNMIAGGVPKE